MYVSISAFACIYLTVTTYTLFDLRCQVSKAVLEVCDDVCGVLEAAREAHHAWLDATGNELFVGQLTMRGARRVQHAGTAVSHMNLNRGELQGVEQLGGTVRFADPEIGGATAVVELPLG